MKAAKNFRGIEKTELTEKLLGFREELAKEKAVIASGTRAEKPAKIKNLRRNIARILTILKEQEKRKVKK